MSRFKKFVLLMDYFKESLMVHTTRGPFNNGQLQQTKKDALICYLEKTTTIETQSKRDPKK